MFKYLKTVLKVIYFRDLLLFIIITHLKVSFLFVQSRDRYFLVIRFFRYLLFCVSNYSKKLLKSIPHLMSVLINIFVIEGTAPLARTTSMSSCAGYHTPIEDEVAGEAISDLPSSDLGRNGIFVNTQVNKIKYFVFSVSKTKKIIILHQKAPSPMSAILTVSLDGYLDQQRISFESPPGSDIAVPQQHHSVSDESYPVFSPIPDAVRKTLKNILNHKYILYKTLSGWLLIGFP